MTRLLVSRQDVLRFRISKNLFLFGTGVDGIRFLREYGKYIKIHAFLDNGIPSGEEKLIDGIPAYNADDMLSSGLKYHLLITTTRYWKEICTQVEKYGLQAEKDYHVWCALNLNPKNIYDFIDHNNKVWRKFNNTNKKNKILLATDSGHSGQAIYDSYYANVFAQQYDAEIVMAESINLGELAPLIKEVCESFNVNTFLHLNLSSCQKERVDKLYKDIYPNLLSKYDWMNITIDGINYGRELYATFTRFVSIIYDFDRYEVLFQNIFRKTLELIVFYEDYFESNSVVIVLLTTGFYYESVLRSLAWKHGAKVYSIVNGKIHRYVAGDTVVDSRYGCNYKEEFSKLTYREQKEGLEWAKNKLDIRLSGGKDTKFLITGTSPYAEKCKGTVLEKNDKIKVVICPHAISDYPYPSGEFMFADHYDWLEFLCEISEQTNYDWYIKYHPDAGEESFEPWDHIIKKYPHIKKLPFHISPKQLSTEGMDFALTLWGSIGYEYPLLGIQVISAAHSPYDNFEFVWNPKTMDEYKQLLMNLHKAKKQINTDEIYQFYFMHFKKSIPTYAPRNDIFFVNHRINDDGYPCPAYMDEFGRLLTDSLFYQDWSYRFFVDDFSHEHHDFLVNNIKKVIADIDGICHITEHDKKEGNWPQSFIKEIL